MPQNLSLSPSSGLAGSNVQVSFNVANSGAGTSYATTANIRLSTSSSAPSTSDPLLSTVNINALSSGGSQSFSPTFTIPAGTASGQKYIWVIVDPSNSANQGSNTNDDRVYAGYNVTAPAQYANLVPQNLSLSPSSGLAGSNVQVSFNVANSGAGTSYATTANIRLSTSSSAPSTSDPLLGTVNINALSSGGSQSFSPTFTIPAGTASGQKYIWVIVDPSNNANQGTATNDDRVYAGYNVASSGVTNDYPATLANAAQDSLVDPYGPGSGQGFYNRECTSYVAWRMNRDHGTVSAPYYFTNYMVGPNGTQGHWGNASNWVTNAQLIGFTVDHTPEVGAIAWFSYGHVAYVEGVNGNGTVNISEYNYYVNSNPGTWSQRSNLSPDWFIHVNGAVSQYANLVPQNLSLSPSSGLAGSSVQVSFNVANSGAGTSYATTANIRLSTSSSAPSTSDPLLGTVNINALSSGGSQAFSPTFTIPAGTASGQKYIWVIVDPNNSANQGSNINDDRVYAGYNVTTGQMTRSPYGGTPWSIPGTIQAENFDTGGEGVAYHDTSTANEGGAYRPTEAVDLETVSGRTDVGWVRAGEWLEYTINVPAGGGTYNFQANVASTAAGGKFRVLFDGVDKTGLIAVPNTTSWTAWQQTAALPVTLSGGQHVMRVALDTAASNGYVGNFDWFALTATNVIPPGAGDGLSASYYDNKDFTGLFQSRVDPIVDFNWGTGSPISGMGVDTFSVRWTGQVQPQYSETYRFYVTSDDGVSLWVNGQQLVNNWTDHAPVENGGTIVMVAGLKYDIRLDYYESAGGAMAKLEWSSPNQARQVIPRSQLFNNGPIDWFSANLIDTGIITVARSVGSDQQLSRNDMVSVFREAANDDGVVDATELADLRRLVASGTSLGMPDYVRVLSNKVANSDPANQHYLQAALGDLTAGSPKSKMDTLLNKWFFGKDHPLADYPYVTVSGSLFQGGATYTDIHQGGVRDCYFLASLAEVAARSPSGVSTMFVTNADSSGAADGTYTVRFYRNGVADYVTVDSQLPADNGQLVYASPGAAVGNTANELWVALAEKAYAQENESGWLERPTSAQNGENSYQAIERGWGYTVMKQLTARNTVHDTDLRNPSPGDFDSIVADFNAGRLTVLNGYMWRGGEIQGAHAFALVGYDPNTQQFSVYNPWGTGGLNGLYGWSWAEITSSCIVLDNGWNVDFGAAGMGRDYTLS